MRVHSLWALFLFSAVCAGTASARTWTSKAGTTLDAELTEMGATHVVLQKPDGAKISIPITALSEADQAFLKDGNEPLQPVAATPAPDPAAQAPGPAATSAGKPALTECELRTWTDRDGATIQARLVKHTPTTLTLQNENGIVLQVPLLKVSDKDKKYLESLKYQELELQPPPPENFEWPIGEISGVIKCKNNEKWSYNIYLPKHFNLSRKWPVMFIMSPSGGGSRVFDFYKEGAELNDWILAVSMESRNQFDESPQAAKAMFEDVLARFPIDATRLYSSGFDGGARLAFALAAESRDDFAGILPCGSGALGLSFKSKTHIYGVHGSKSFNRWYMWCTFKEYRKGQSFLWIYPGEQEWASPQEFTDGMCWLNNKYLEDNFKKSKEQEAEWFRFMKMMVGQVAQLKESDPERAYRLIRLLDKTKAHPFFRTDLETLTKDLEGSETIKQYKLAEREMMDIAEKYFQTNPMDYKNNNCPTGLMKDAARVAEKYKDLKLSATIKTMGGPAPF